MIYSSLVALSLVAVGAASSVTTAGVKYSAGKYNIVSADEGDVSAEYTIDKNGSGWNYLDLSVNADAGSMSIDDYLTTMKAAGVLEGYMTCQEFKTYWPNFYADSFGSSGPDDEVLQFLQDNYDWVTTQSEKLSSTSNYWLNVRGTLAQINGLLEGYQASSCNVAGEEGFSLINWLMINAWGDMYTISTKYAIENLTPEEIQLRRQGHRSIGRMRYPKAHQIEKDLRCSALFKVLPDYSDIFFGHVTWDGFEALFPRIFKRFNLPSMDVESSKASPSMIPRDVFFSSSPGLLSSVDDFYTVNQVAGKTAKLAVIETTNDLFNPDEFEIVKPESVLSWMRVIASNQVAYTGAQWSELFSIYHSGTYTNQWMILDMTRFVPGSSAVQPGLFTVAEEIPSSVHYEDMTSTLYSQMYWPSYNIPYFEDINKQSGNYLVCKVGEKSNSTEFCYDQASRANIFRDQQASIADLDDFKYMINYNNWQTDPNSKGDSCNAIACRRDLEEEISSVYPAGGLDAKASSVLLATKSTPEIHARLGPTHDDQEPFCWSNLKQDYVHNGQPDCFTFDWTSIV